MEQIYIRERHLTTLRIREVGNYLERAKSTVKTLSAKPGITDFDRKQIDKQKQACVDYEKETLALEKRLEDLNAKRLDLEFREEIDKIASDAAKENQKKIQNDRSKVELKKTQSVFEQKSKDVNRYNDTGYVSKKQMEYELNRFFSVYDSIPDRTGIKSLLKRLPNNQGFIWNGVWLFGEMPAEPNKPLSMQEKLRNSDILRTYEIDDEFQLTYEKRGRDRRVLVAKEPRSEFHKHIKARFGL